MIAGSSGCSCDRPPGDLHRRRPAHILQPRAHLHRNDHQPDLGSDRGTDPGDTSHPWSPVFGCCDVPVLRLLGLQLLPVSQTGSTLPSILQSQSSASAGLETLR